MRKSLARVSRYFYYGLKDPRAALTYISAGRQGITWLFLERLLKVNRDVIDKLLNELRQDKKFIQYIQSSLAEVGRYLGEISEPEVLYVIVRVLRPEKVVETGVAAGVSSAFILKGLDDNEMGYLYSIDLPNYEIELAKRGIMKEPVAVLPEGKEPGFVVPSWLKNRWRLTLGKSREVLGPLLEELREIDIFLHDSEHSYENMMFEFETAWKHLRSSGLLLSHDITWNRSFFDFARKVRRTAVHLYFAGIGGIHK